MTSETEQGQRLSQGQLKRITQGMGMIKAVRKYENPIEFPETHKLWMDTNRKPTIGDGDDAATFNRLHPIPFTVTIAKDQIDRELPAKLLAEAEGILAWSVRGAKRWYASGLPQPPEIVAACNDWKAESDPLAAFLDERCVVDPTREVQAAHLYAAYKSWADDSGEKAFSAKVFGEKLKQRGMPKKLTRRAVFYLGIALKRDPGAGGGA
jgi:putative DNA primase/helicase